MVESRCVAIDIHIRSTVCALPLKAGSQYDTSLGPCVVLHHFRTSETIARFLDHNMQGCYATQE